MFDDILTAIMLAVLLGTIATCSNYNAIRADQAVNNYLREQIERPGIRRTEI